MDIMIKKNPEISLHFLPYMFPLPKVVGLGETTIKLIMSELCDRISVTEHEVHRSNSLNG